MRRLCALALLAALAEAGSGPETTLLVVNGESLVSRRIANEYVALRGVPASHLLVLDGIPSLDVISLAGFRARIWKPIREFLKEQGLEEEIDLIAYSGDFPYGVDVTPLLRGVDVGETTTPIASLTGLTFFGRRVEAGDASLVDLHANRYCRVDFNRPPLTTRSLTGEERKRFAKAMGAMMAKDFRGAAEAYADFLATYTSHPMSWFNYAVCLARSRQPEKAVAALDKGVTVGWNDVQKTEEEPSFGGLVQRLDFQRVLERMREREGRVQAAHSFSSRSVWSGAEQPWPDDGASLDRYWLSVMLGYTGTRGNSLPEVLACLRSAKRSDATEPEGTVYLGYNMDPRTRARDLSFPGAARAMKALNRRMSVLKPGEDGQNGVVPIGKQDVIGVVAGTPGFDWAKSKSRILRGAICEHLTSFGGAFADPRDTKLSSWIRAGAAGSSGTAGEGFSIYQKFPQPHLHVHYAEGCSLAESFFLSVSGPYQLLVVGDPLARPFARFATIAWTAPGPLEGAVELRPHVTEADGEPVGEIELWIDGQRLVTGAPRKPLLLDTTRLDDGAHSLRVVAIAADRIATRSSALFPIVVDNRGGSCTLSVRGKADLPFGKSVTLHGKAPGAVKVELRRGARILETKTLKGGSFTFTLDTASVGPGPVELYARAWFGAGRAARSAPVRLRIVDPAELGAPSRALEAALPGIESRITTADRKETALLLPSLGSATMAAIAKDRDIRRLEADGAFLVPESGLHQLVVNGRGTLTVVIGKTKVAQEIEIDGLRYLPLALRAGRHPIRIEYVARGPFHFDVTLAGPQVAAPLQGLTSPGAPLAQRPAINGKRKELVDGNRRGKARGLTRAGAELSFADAVKAAAIVLIPQPKRHGKEPWPTGWIIETKLKKSPWRALKKLEIVNAPGPRPKGGEHDVPAYVLLRFKPVKLTTLRIRPADDSLAYLTEIEVYGPR